MRIKALPRVLALHLKRFEHSASTKTSRKLSHYVHFPSTLDMAPFVTNAVVTPPPTPSASSALPPTLPQNCEATGADSNSARIAGAAYAPVVGVGPHGDVTGSLPLQAELGPQGGSSRVPGVDGACGQPASPAVSLGAVGLPETPTGGDGTKAVHAWRPESSAAVVGSARALFGSGSGQGTREGAPDTDAHSGAAQEGPRRSMVFDIFGVVTHSGNLESGHYVSYARVSGRWFKFDDAWVTAVDEEDVRRAEAYMLFYAERELQ